MTENDNQMAFSVLKRGIRVYLVILAIGFIAMLFHPKLLLFFVLVGLAFLFLTLFIYGARFGKHVLPPPMLIVSALGFAGIAVSVLVGIIELQLRR